MSSALVHADYRYESSADIGKSTHAIARRRVTIFWPVTIPAYKSYSSLRERLSQELPGILGGSRSKVHGSTTVLGLVR